MKKATYRITIIAAIGLCLIFALLGPKEKTRQERIESLFSNLDGSQPEVEKWIKANIKDAGSYKHLETNYIDETDQVKVITTFTASNGFGANVKTTCFAEIDTLGKLIKAEIQEQ